MKIERLSINEIPAIIWGENSKKAFIAVHGNISNKEDEVIKILADVVAKKGYQLISFDLPEHGERKDKKDYLCKVQNCVKDLNTVMNSVKDKYDEINLWACSMGAFFSMLAYKEVDINQCLFLSPVVNMKIIIDNLMSWSNVTEEELKAKQEIKTDFGQVLYWDYYEYVKCHPITSWDKNTSILYGKNDKLQSYSLIEDFSNRFKCGIIEFENGEHYFHTEEQLEFYKNWLNEIIS